MRRASRWIATLGLSAMILGTMGATTARADSNWRIDVQFGSSRHARDYNRDYDRDRDRDYRDHDRDRDRDNHRDRDHDRDRDHRQGHDRR